MTYEAWGWHVNKGCSISEGTLFPLEFFVEGTPKSLQASAESKSVWMETVGKTANDRIRETVDWVFLDDRRVAVTIFYFAPDGMEGDIDNIIKPILDGMENSAYLNDRVVEKVLVQKFEPGVERVFDDVSEQLAAALDAKAPVVYVRVDTDLSWRRVSWP